MKEFLALFPLNIVAFPNEAVNLHIFEPRYRELIKDVMGSEIARFGIPSFVQNKLEWGTEVEIIEISKSYDDGRKDIKTKAKRAFKVLDYVNPLEGKTYAAGHVEYLEYIMDGEEAKMNQIVDMAKELYQLAGIQNSKIDQAASVFDVGHHLGLSKEQELQMLQIIKESDRQEFIYEHLKELIPKMKDIRQSEHIIRQNGHFKYFDPLEF